VTRSPSQTTLRAAVVLLSSIAIAAVAVVLFWPESDTATPRAPVTPADRIERVPADLFERPPLNDEITLATPGDVELRRAELRRFVFGSAGLPTGLPDVERGIEDPEFSEGLTNLKRIDRLTIALPIGFTSIAYHLVPRRANGRLLVYHHGHVKSFRDGATTIARFLDRGYALLVFAMPLAGHNTNPEELDTPCGRVDLSASAGPRTEHDAFACLPQPLRYFLEPLAVGLNYASRLYDGTAMVGLSGGGWTTVVYAALDPRVQRSYPVAGSEPFHVTARTCAGETPETVPKCFGDFEQRLPDLYRIANYLELYTLGGFGPGRRQLAIYNVFDPCCFSGRGYEEWRPRVQGALRRLGSGAYDAIGDTTHRQHVISPFALRAIEADLAGA
jgi:pimeloyl-ACP methyl ester carboxylesterase